MGRPDGAADAGAAEAGAPADAAALGAEDDVPVLQAAITIIATIARAGSLRCVLIQSSSNRPGRGLPASGRRSYAPGLWHSIISEFACIHSISVPSEVGRMTEVSLGIALWSQASDWPAFLAAARSAERSGL